jgi:hypothetical protein
MGREAGSGAVEAAPVLVAEPQIEFQSLRRGIDFPPMGDNNESDMTQFGVLRDHNQTILFRDRLTATG